MVKCIKHYAFRISGFSFVWEHPRDLPRVDVSDRCRPAQAPLPFPRLVAEDVLLERFAPEKLAVLGPLEALGGAPVRLELELFRHETVTLPA
jgi:hypothetical protein